MLPEISIVYNPFFELLEVLAQFLLIVIFDQISCTGIEKQDYFFICNEAVEKLGGSFSQKHNKVYPLMTKS